MRATPGLPLRIRSAANGASAVSRASRREALAARHDGFTAKALIHPSHVDVVKQAFMPTHAEVDWAGRVMALVAGSPAGGVFVLDGRMVDLPHIRKAKGILEMAGVSG